MCECVCVCLFICVVVHIFSSLLSLLRHVYAYMHKSRTHIHHTHTRIHPHTGKEIEILEKDPGYIDSVLAKGAERARTIAAQTMKEVRDVIGML